MKNFYVTTPIYYVNSVPHLGHAYTTIVADFVSRFHALLGQKTYFLTGTDEHGDKISKTAKNQNKTPQQLVDENSKHFRDLLPIINAQNNDFIRTTEKRHKDVVIHFLNKCYEKGDIYFGEYGGKYCIGCERYYGDDELVDGKCPDHQTVPEKIVEKNYFFKMSNYFSSIKKHIEANPDWIVPAQYKNEVLGLLNMDAQDLCISRPKNRLDWGIELPFDKNYVTYVWFDALINYLSALGFPDGKLCKEYWPNSHHLIAKDILKPHCIYWPTMLLSYGVSLPKQIIIHGYWLVNESKMSKSLGNVVSPKDYCAKYGADCFRYFLIRGMNFGKDAHYSEADFITLINADLANKIGNLYARIVGLIKKNNNGLIPQISQVSEVAHLQSEGTSLLEKLSNTIENWELQNYPGLIINFAENINKFLDEVKPWSLVKDPSKKETALNLLGHSLEGVRIIYGALLPLMPEKSQIVLKELGFNDYSKNYQSNQKTWNLLEKDYQLPESITGFPRIEVPKE